MNVIITHEILNKIKKINIRQYLEDNYDCSFVGINCKCPHPDHEDRHPSFSVWTDKLGNYYWCCHSCHCGKTNLLAKEKNYGTDIIGLIRWLSDYNGSNHIFSFQEAAVIAMEYANISYNTITDKHDKQYKISMAVADNCCKQLLSNKNLAAYKYLLSRNLDDNDIKNWKLGFNGLRITFPLFNRSSNVIGFSNRVINNNDNKAPKYVNSMNNDIFNKSHYLYGVHKFNSNLDYVYITEGQMDVIMAYKYGLKNVAASLGTSFNDGHISYLKKNFPNITKIIFVFDNDFAGKKALVRCAELARNNGYSTFCCILPCGQDLFDFAVHNKDNTINEIARLTQYYFFYELKDDINMYESVIFHAKNNIVNKLLPIYNSTTNPNEKYAIKTYALSKYNIDISA